MHTQVKEPTTQKVGVAATQTEVSEEEFNRIAAVLKYKGTSRDYGRATLASVLRELDIAVLNPRSVARYKRERMAEAKKKMPNNYSSWSSVRWEWATITLPKYTKSVPVATLQLAARIAERLPDAVFTVEELRRRRVVVDPFLAVQYRGAKYYIAHWDEPNFVDE